MAMRSKEFVGKAEGIKSHELSVKSLIESIKGTLSSLTGKINSLERELSSLYAELAAAENDYDDDDGPDYGLIASIERQIDQTNDELETTEGDISETTGELEKAEQEYEKVEEEKQQTLFEIQQRARTYSQDIAKIGGAYGAYATIGQSISQSMQANYDALSKAATILDGSIDSIGSGRSSSGGGSGGGNGSSLAGSNGAAAIAGASNIRPSNSSTSSMRSSQGSVGNSSNGRLRSSNGGNIGIKLPSYTSSQISRQGVISSNNVGKSIISSNIGTFSFQSNQEAYDSGIVGNPNSFGSREILENGTIIFTGNDIVIKGNHSGMPRRTDAYLPGDERGHIQASSLGGDNTPQNVVPQASDLNHGAYYRMEQTERNLINQGNNIQSQKIAYSSNQPGKRPDAFMVNDTIMHPNGTTEVVHLSFANLMNNEQESLNSYLEKQMDIVDVQNPADVLRETLTSKDYAALMEATAGEMLNIDDEYAGTCLMITQELSGGVLETGRMAPTVAPETNKKEAIESTGSDIDQQAGVVFDIESQVVNVSSEPVLETVVGDVTGGHSIHGFFDWINPKNYTPDGRYIGEGKEWGYKPYGEDTSTFQEKIVGPEVLALNQYMSQKGYGGHDMSAYVTDSTWQVLHKKAYGDDSLSSEIAFAQLRNYMQSHNYTIFDYGTYMLDPEWQRLSSRVYGESAYIENNPAVARKLLQEYMFFHRYSETDRPIYSKDPTWIRLHKICYGEKTIERGEYKHISKMQNAGVGDISKAENGTLLLLTTPDGFERKYTKTDNDRWVDDYGGIENDLSIREYIENKGFKGIINNVSEIPFFENNTSLNGFQGMMRGRDVTSIVKSGKIKVRMNDIAEVQGFNKKPKLVGLDEFQASVERSGVLCFRTWSDGIDVSSKEKKKSEIFKDEFSKGGKFVHNGSGGQVYGAGIYLTATVSPHRGFSPNEERIEAARNGSVIYGKARRKTATWSTACITISQDATIVDGHSLQEKFKALSFAEKKKYKMDVGKYAIALGYDGAIWKTSFGCDYYTIYNRSSLIVLDDPGNIAYGID